ncbi:MarR family winged helix-turn-helix transcriptional regulator [Longimycelium tulufanense]|nr:MarR family winged helix-turn-helix transcriptional regulator [Longimycelium tulufanense]
MRRSDLAHELGMTPSGVTRALVPLERVGLVSREPDPRDARVEPTVFTPAGERRLAEATRR